jgi:hypothetical protein
MGITVPVLRVEVEWSVKQILMNVSHSLARIMEYVEQAHHLVTLVLALLITLEQIVKQILMNVLPTLVTMEHV